MKKFIAIAVAIALLIAWISHSIFKRYDHPEQISLAVIQLELVGSNVELFFTDNGYLPESLDQLSYSGDKGPYLQTKQLKDPWGRLLFYRKDSDGKSFLLFTLGSDGRIGGSGHESDRQFEKNIPLAANNSFKPTPCRGVGHVPALR